MKRIPLNKGKFALVDDDDYDYLMQWKWGVDQHGYASRSSLKEEGKKRTIKMHRIINKTPEGFVTDHINRDVLDNRRCNLRTVTKSQNIINSGLWANNKSRHKGVQFDAKRKKWRAYICLNYEIHWLGYHKKKTDAISARKEAEIIYHSF